MTTAIVPTVPATVEHESAEVLCERADCIANVVAHNIRALLTRALDAEDRFDVVMEEIFCTAVILALFEAHGVPLDTPAVDAEVTLPTVNRIGAELGLIGCSARIEPATKRRAYSGH